jgi:RNase_H superfamily
MSDRRLQGEGTTVADPRHKRFCLRAKNFIIRATAPRVAGLRLAFDIEANGLLEAATTIHCVVIADLDTDQIDQFGPDQIDAALARLSEARYLTGHNATGYDLPLLRKLCSWSPAPEVAIVDTLIVSRLVLAHMRLLDVETAEMGDPDLGKLKGSHSLAAWGQRLGRLKSDQTSRNLTLGRRSCRSGASATLY